eukprot:976727-Amphidinium_carterae.1
MRSALHKEFHLRERTRVSSSAVANCRSSDNTSVRSKHATGHIRPHSIHIPRKRGSIELEPPRAASSTASIRSDRLVWPTW